MENKVLRVGYGKGDMTPPMGVIIPGYFMPRYVEGILDKPEIIALAIESGEEKAVIVTLDAEGYVTSTVEFMKEVIAEQLCLKKEQIFIAATHTHTAPMLAEKVGMKSEAGDSRELECKYFHKKFIPSLIKTVKKALKDLTPAKMGYGVGVAPNIAFVRRFIMKDGSVATNPGPNNPNIDRPLGDVDERVNVVRFVKENGENIVLANFGNHPDTIGGCKISGDWPAFTRRVVEKTLDNTKCIFLNGAQGDVNHVNVHPKEGDYNEMFLDFDDVQRGYAHSRYMGRVVTGGILQAFDKVKFIDNPDLAVLQKRVKIPSNMPDKKDMELAHKYYELHKAGKDDQIPFTGMALTTVVAEAKRMVALENGPEYFEMPLSGLRLGEVGLVGFPGEPFTGIGRGVKMAEDYGMVMPCCFMNGGEGYFPMQDAYDEGGYEARSSYLKAGVAELFIKEGLDILKQLKK